MTEAAAVVEIHNVLLRIKEVKIAVRKTTTTEEVPTLGSVTVPLMMKATRKNKASSVSGRRELRLNSYEKKI